MTNLSCAKVSIIEKDKNGYYAFCPDLTGCHSQGDTLDETIENIKEAVELYLEVLSPEERRLLCSRNYYSFC